MWNKSAHVFAFQMKLVPATPRIGLIFILIAIFVFSNLQGVLDFSRDVGIPATPWAFPHIASDFICQLVIMAGVVALFCDAPFNSEIQKYILPRAGHTAYHSFDPSMERSSTLSSRCTAGSDSQLRDSGSRA